MNKLVRRLSVYIFTALATLAIGLGCSLYFATNDGLFVSRVRRLFSNQESHRKPQPQIVGGIAGHGFSADGFPKSFSNHDYSDGTFIHQESIFYPSPARANQELEKRIKLAGAVVRRQPMVNKEGKTVGETVVTSNAELLWTDGERLVIQKRRSVQDILEALELKL